MRYSPLIIILLLSSIAFADVELMVKGNEYWKSTKDTSGWTKADYEDYHKQKQKGEVISILNGGKKFGRLDVPPAIIHITVTGITKEEANLYMMPLTEGFGDTITVKERKYQIPDNIIDSAITIWNADSSIIVWTKAEFEAVVKEYDMSTIKQMIIDREKK